MHITKLTHALYEAFFSATGTRFEIERHNVGCWCITESGKLVRNVYRLADAFTHLEELAAS